jgi:hypothetical protein
MTKYGRRYAVSETARLEMLDRLLALNHARWAAQPQDGRTQARRPAKRTVSAANSAFVAQLFDGIGG